MNRYLLRLQLLLGLAFLAGLLGGCSPGDRLPCPGPTEEMVLGPEEGRVAITLQNDTCMSVCVLSVAPDHCDDIVLPLSICIERANHWAFWKAVGKSV
jgi:hypothetical protein